VAGSLAAFNAHMLTRLPHLRAMHLEFLPLAISHSIASRPGARARRVAARQAVALRR
jgi:hypothetical protein